MENNLNMVAVITSTSIVRNRSMWPENYLVDQNTRIKQTQDTIASLKSLGLKDIYLFDNSGVEFREYLEDVYKGVNLVVQNQYSFKNKGISEIHLLLNNLRCLPNDQCICKISGRYLVSDKDGFWKNAKWLHSYDIVALKRDKGISTRMYFIKSREVLEEVLNAMLNRCYHRQYSITGLRSLRKFLKRIFYKQYPIETPFLAIENSFYEIRKKKIKYVDKMYLKGTLALDPSVVIDE